MLKAVRTVAPTDFVVSIDEVRQHLRIEHYDEDPLLERLIETATDHVEGPRGVAGLALLTQTWRIDVSGFEERYPDAPVYLLPQPVQSITSVTYYDANGAQQTLATSVYRYFDGPLGPYLALRPDQDWPSIYDRDDAISITFRAGYGDTPASVPAAIRHGILLMIGHLYANREAVIVGAIANEMHLGFKNLIGPMRPLFI